MPIRFLTAGESHGPRLTAILEGMVAGLPLTPSDLVRDLARRQKGFGRGGRMAIEKDRADFTGSAPDVEAALDRAAGLDGRTCLLDMGDNVGGGSPDLVGAHIGYILRAMRDDERAYQRKREPRRGARQDGVHLRKLHVPHPRV